jgi:anti-sigma regulatory factor (Ser/Thr protein kinase)
MIMEMAADEIFSNIAKYAYRDEDLENSAVVELRVTDGAIEMTIIDFGIPFDPLSALKPDVTLSAENRKPGGLGIHMVRSSVDAMRYERDKDRNVMTITKTIDQ